MFHKCFLKRVHLGIEAGVLNSDAYIREVAGQVYLQMYPQGKCPYSGQIDVACPSEDHTAHHEPVFATRQSLPFVARSVMCVRDA